LRKSNIAFSANKAKGKIISTYTYFHLFFYTYGYQPIYVTARSLLKVVSKPNSMKSKPYLALLFILFSNSSFAQQHFVKAGAGVGHVPYARTSLNFEVQYENVFSPKVSTFLSVGRSKYFFSPTEDGLMQIGDRYYEHTFTSRFHYMDMGLRMHLFSKINKRYQCKAAVGSSFGYAVDIYPGTFVTQNGELLRPMQTHRVRVMLLLTGIEQRFRMHRNILFILNATLRTNLGDKQYYSAVTSHGGGTSSSGSRILFVPNLVLQLGYAF
jgi:hypothetical protein